MSSTTQPSSDLLSELDTLVSQLANLDKQILAGKIKEDEFSLLSKSLKERIASAEAAVYSQARKDVAVARKLRLRNYNDPAVQQVLNHLLSGSANALEPEFGSDRLPTYSVRLEGGDRVPVDRPLLQRMADIGFVNETLFEKVVFCPSCSSPSKVYARFKCTHCGSIDILMSRMIEHLICGTIHQEEAFRVGKNMVCPTCKKLLQKPEEHRLIGLVCSCKACGAHFEDPAQGFFCRNCKLDFALPTAQVVDAYTYSINKEALVEVRAHLGVDALMEAIASEGYEVRSPGIVSTPTKEIEFSLIVRRDSKFVAVDISQSEVEVDVEPLLQLYVKMLEASPTKAVFGAVPRLSDRARKLADLHEIAVAEAAKVTELTSKIIEIARATI